MEAPPGFRYIDIHTHLHPDRLARAIRRWFAERSTWKLEHPSEPEEVAAYLAKRGVERFVYFSYAHKAGMARDINAWLHDVRPRVPAGIPLGTVHPDDPDMMEVAEEALIRYGFPGFKVHINVPALLSRPIPGSSTSTSACSPSIASSSFTWARRPGPTSTTAFPASSG
jgi:hypothetical protein